MNRSAVTLVLVCLLLSAVVPVATADDDPLDAVPAGILWRHDDDGGRTWQLQIDDDPTGPVTHTSLHEQLPPEAQALLVAEVRDFGLYTHIWGTSAIHVTYGLYFVTDTMGLERFPLVVVEGEPPLDFVAFLEAKLAEIALPAANNHLPYLTNYLLPTSLLLASLGVAGYGPPTDYPQDGAMYRDFPTLYLWTAHKDTAGAEVWQGWYLARSGSAGADATTAFAERRIELGPATRVDGDTQHLAALYVEEDNRRAASATTSHMEQTFTVGATTQGTDVPLLVVQASDDRHDDEQFYLFYPDSQTTGYSVGVRGPDGAYIPLIGTYTESESEFRADGTIPNKRTTSVGVFVLGEYQPVIGFRYEGERYPLELWAALWALSGGPGTDLSGDIEVTAGYFVLGTYQPVLSLRYDDSFAEANERYQAMIRLGAYANGYDGPYVPLVGVTYDGTHPLVAAAVADEATWLVSAGTFVLDAYFPVLGVSFASYRDDGAFAAHEEYQVGVFVLGDYDQFVPLATATWDAHMSLAAWVLSAQTELGEDGREADVALGVVGVGPVVGVQYRSAGETDNPYGGMATLGVFVAGDFVPVAGVAHCTPAPGVDGLQPAARPVVVIGVHAAGSFVPLVRVTLSDDPSAVTVEPLPSEAC